MERLPDPPWFLPPGQHARWLVAYRELWQMELLDPWDFAIYVSRHGLDLLGRDGVIALWRLSLIRADLIESTTKLRWRGLRLIRPAVAPPFFYADCRESTLVGRGWLNSVGRSRSLPDGVRLLFHPFRYLVLYHLLRVLGLSISTLQPLYSTRGLSRLARQWLTFLRQWSAESGTDLRVRSWNALADLAVAAEPCAYPEIFHTYRVPWPTSEAEFRQRLAAYRAIVHPTFEQIGETTILGLLEGLGIDLRLLDANHEIHRLLRLTQGDARLKLEGQFGGAMLLLTMMESLRRVYERASGAELPEEDELSGGFFPGAKERLYGTRRLLDGDPKVQREFVRSEIEAETGVRARLYVEGATELAAFRSALGDAPHIDFVDLRGRFVEANTLQFAQSLKADRRNSVVSIVVLDGDTSTNLRVVRTAAQRDEMFGPFFIFIPDFEFANFTVDELTDVLWGWAQEFETPRAIREQLHARLGQRAPQSGREFFAAAHAVPELAGFDKGEDWGRHLSEFAARHLHRRETDEERTMVSVVAFAARARIASYTLSLREFRTDPGTGNVIPRETRGASPA